MSWLQQRREWLDDNRGLGLDLVRVYLGVALAAKGVSLVAQGRDLFERAASSIGVGQGLLSHYVILAHLGGGILLAVGIGTRFAAAVQVPALVGAVMFIHVREGLFASTMGLQLTLLVLFLLLVFSVFGSGRLSIDHGFDRLMTLEPPQTGSPA